MKTGTIWAIALGAGIPGILILIGIIGLLIKFFMKRCQTKAWDEISSLPKDLDSSKLNHRRSSSHEQLCPPIINPLEESVATPIDVNNVPSGQNQAGDARQHEHTLVQIQRERLDRLKKDDHRLKPIVRPNHGEDDIQREIAQANKEFEESV